MRVTNLCLCFLLLICVHNLEVCASENEVLLTKLGGNAGPTLKFLYCYSCGYRKVFDDYVGILSERYPELHIYGENFNPPGYNMFIAKFLGVAKLLVIVLILSKVNVFQWFGQPQPSWWQWCLDNRAYAGMMLFFLCNTIEGQLISSGAFEIQLNDVPVWSKLETGRIPQPPELFQIIDNHIRFQEVGYKDAGGIGFNK